MTSWTAHPNCPEHIREELEAKLRSLPPSFLVAPAAGEVFENADLCQDRLQGWALSQGFEIVRLAGSMKEAQPRFRFHCIHHGKGTANKRQLEDHVEVDKEQNKVSRRQREATSIYARNCPYIITLPHKQLGKRGSGVYGLVLGIRNDTHSHEMTSNPLRYLRHIKGLPSYPAAVELGRSYQRDTAERSAQVNLMRQIYRNSAKVWIWLGPALGIRVEMVSELIRKIARASREVQIRLEGLKLSAASTNWGIATIGGNYSRDISRLLWKARIG